MGQLDNDDISQEIIDRLVDGELEETIRATVLQRLEQDPVLCKRIAVAFLENQAWREAFSTHCSALATRTTSEGSLENLSPTKGGTGSKSSESAPAELTSEGCSPQPIRASAEKPRFGLRVSTLGWIIAVAASFVFAFLASFYVQSFWLTRTRQAPTLSGGSLAARGGRASSENQSVASASGESISTPTRVEMVSVPLPIDDAGTWATMEVPFISSPGAGIAEVLPGGVIPAEILESLGAQGHIVEQERRFVPVALPDGRQSIVPIDQVRIRFVDWPKR